MSTVEEGAPPGPRKNAALRHYQAAEKAQIAKNNLKANRALDAASAKLG